MNMKATVLTTVVHQQYNMKLWLLGVLFVACVNAKPHSFGEATYYSSTSHSGEQYGGHSVYDNHHSTEFSHGKDLSAYTEEHSSPYSEISSIILRDNDEFGIHDIHHPAIHYEYYEAVPVTSALKYYVSNPVVHKESEKKISSSLSDHAFDFSAHNDYDHAFRTFIEPVIKSVSAASSSNTQSSLVDQNGGFVRYDDNSPITIKDTSILKSLASANAHTTYQSPISDYKTVSFTNSDTSEEYKKHLELLSTSDESSSEDGHGGFIKYVYKTPFVLEEAPLEQVSHENIASFGQNQEGDEYKYSSYTGIQPAKLKTKETSYANAATSAQNNINTQIIGPTVIYGNPAVNANKAQELPQNIVSNKDNNKNHQYHVAESVETVPLYEYSFSDSQASKEQQVHHDDNSEGGSRIQSYVEIPVTFYNSQQDNKQVIYKDHQYAPDFTYEKAQFYSENHSNGNPEINAHAYEITENVNEDLSNLNYGQTNVNRKQNNVQEYAEYKGENNVFANQENFGFVKNNVVVDQNIDHEKIEQDTEYGPVLFAQKIEEQHGGENNVFADQQNSGTGNNNVVVDQNVQINDDDNTEYRNYYAKNNLLVNQLNRGQGVNNVAVAQKNNSNSGTNNVVVNQRNEK